MKYSLQDIQQVHALRKEGYKHKEIAELTDIPAGTVGAMLTNEHYLDKWGLTITGRKYKFAEKEVKREKNHSKAILILFCEGKSKSQISNTLDLPIDIVSTIIDSAIELGKLQQKWVINEEDED